MYIYFPPANLINQGSGIIASSNNYQFPVSLIYQSHLACDVWRSAVGNATETLTIDLGGSWKAADYPNGLDILVDSWNANDVCSAVSVTSTGPGGTTVLALTGDSSTPQHYNIALDPTTGTTALVITFTKALITTYMQVGKLFVGAPYDTGQQATPDMKGLSRTFMELANKDKSVLGQSFSEIRAVYDAFSLVLPVNPEAVETVLRKKMFRALGTSTPFWLRTVPGDPTTAELDQPFYCKMTASAKEGMVGYGGSPAGYLWSLSLQVEKQL